jgi:hypothetical protein
MTPQLKCNAHRILLFYYLCLSWVYDCLGTRIINRLILVKFSLYLLLFCPHTLEGPSFLFHGGIFFSYFGVGYLGDHSVGNHHAFDSCKFSQISGFLILSYQQQVVVLCIVYDILVFCPLQPSSLNSYDNPSQSFKILFI